MTEIKIRVFDLYNVSHLAREQFIDRSEYESIVKFLTYGSGVPLVLVPASRNELSYPFNVWEVILYVEKTYGIDRSEEFIFKVR